MWGWRRPALGHPSRTCSTVPPPSSSSPCSPSRGGVRLADRDRDAARRRPAGTSGRRPDQRPRWQDRITGRGGDDHLNGGRGNDTIFGDAGRDVIIGGPGNDTLLGGAGNDRISGGPGSDASRPAWARTWCARETAAWTTSPAGLVATASSPIPRTTWPRATARSSSVDDGPAGPVVLLVDDHDAIRRTVAAGLELEGFSVVPASGGRAGLRRPSACIPRSCCST